ncbi:MAG: hypothetical protein HWN68_16765 [Desulfobacterales bacterium]|nr:hypothetical protein [Desulfobacterales bacterium]
MDTKDRTSSTEPAWLDPKNDRKTPYTEEELELFADGFVNGMGDVGAWQEMIREVGVQRRG